MPAMTMVEAIRDAHVVAMSTLSGNHLTVFPRVLELLADAGASDVLLIGGGIIPEDDAEELKQRGVAAIFGPGTDTHDVVDFVRSRVEGRLAGDPG